MASKNQVCIKCGRVEEDLNGVRGSSWGVSLPRVDIAATQNCFSLFWMVMWGTRGHVLLVFSRLG